jgi:hypothetical protein
MRRLAGLGAKATKQRSCKRRLSLERALRHFELTLRCIDVERLLFKGIWSTLANITACGTQQRSHSGVVERGRFGSIDADWPDSPAATCAKAPSDDFGLLDKGSRLDGLPLATSKSSAKNGCQSRHLLPKVVWGLHDFERILRSELSLCAASL